MKINKKELELKEKELELREKELEAHQAYLNNKQTTNNNWLGFGIVIFVVVVGIPLIMTLIVISKYG